MSGIEAVARTADGDEVSWRFGVGLEPLAELADEVVDVNGELPEATLIVDALWGDPLERALASAAHGARVVHFGQSAAPTATSGSATPPA